MAWMNFILHAGSKNLDVLKRDGLNNNTCYIIKNTTISSDLRKNLMIKSLEIM